MTLQKGTLYGLHAAMELARAWSGAAVTAGEVAERHGLPAAVTAKAFQHLVRAGIAAGTRGTRGGYRLARGPHTVTLQDVIEAFEIAPPPRDGIDPALRRVFEEVEETVRCTYASITLETLVGGRKVTRRGHS